VGVRCGELQLLEQFALGSFHADCRVGIAMGASDALQRVDADPRAQVLFWLTGCEQGHQRSLIVLVANAFAALRIGRDIGPCTEER
jgi:hypothetical protein